MYLPEGVGFSYEPQDVTLYVLARVLKREPSLVAEPCLLSRGC